MVHTASWIVVGYCLHFRQAVCSNGAASVVMWVTQRCPAVMIGPNIETEQKGCVLILQSSALITPCSNLKGSPRTCGSFKMYADVMIHKEIQFWYEDHVLFASNRRSLAILKTVFKVLNIKQIICAYLRNKYYFVRFFCFWSLDNDTPKMIIELQAKWSQWFVKNCRWYWWYRKCCVYITTIAN